MLTEQQKAALEQKQLVTGKISELCRIIGFALLAIFYTINAGENQFTKRILANGEYKIYIIGAAGVLTILFDYLQYFFGSLSTGEALDNPENGFKYNPGSWHYKMRVVFFYAKQITALVGSVVLTIMVLFLA